MELTANYTKDFGNHSLTALVGYSYQQFNQESVYAGNEDFSTDGFLYNNLQAGAGTKPYVNSSARKSALGSYFARANYSYLGKYLLTVTVVPMVNQTSTRTTVGDISLQCLPAGGSVMKNS